MTGQAPFRLTLTLHNNRIIKARERLGWMTQAEACRATGIRATDWSKLESMGGSPIGDRGGWRSSALRMAQALFCEPEDLWPAECLMVSKKSASAELHYAEVMALMGEQPERKLLAGIQIEQMRNLLEPAMKALTPAERSVIKARFWDEKTLDDSRPGTVQSTERVRQIEQKALRRLRTALRQSMIQSRRPAGPLRYEEQYYQEQLGGEP